MKTNKPKTVALIKGNDLKTAIYIAIYDDFAKYSCDYKNEYCKVISINGAYEMIDQKLKQGYNKVIL